MRTPSGLPDRARRRLAPLAAAVVAGGLAVVGLPSAASGASPPVIVYTCPGASSTNPTICAVSPAGGQPRTLAQSGQLAGVTSDGTTYGYESTDGGLWEAPVAGGTPTEVNTSKGGTIAVMSADGQHFLENQFLVGLGQGVIQVDVAAGPSSGYTGLEVDPAASMTYGWVGSTPLTAHANGGMPPSWVCIGGQSTHSHPTCDEGATSPQIQSSTSTLSWPSGSPDGTQIVAIIDQPEQGGATFRGSIALFSATTGAEIRTVATPPAGALYSEPRFSPDGAQIVFESDPVDANGNPTGQGSIDVVNTDGSGLRTLTQGANPSWGGTASAGPTPGPVGALRTAPKITLTLPATRSASLRRTGTLKIGCRLAGAGRCSVSATVTAAVARRLGLKPPRHAKTVQLALGSAVLRHAGRVTITLHLPGRVRRALRRFEVTITGVSTAAGTRPVTVTRNLVLRP